jgi:hypothetical protein
METRHMFSSKRDFLHQSVKNSTWGGEILRS